MVSFVVPAMNIGQFNDAYLPIADGVVNTVHNYAYWLNRKYGNSCIIAPASPDHVDREEFEVIRYTSIPLPSRAPYRLGLPFFDRKVKRRSRSMDLDLIHAHSPFSSGGLALGLARQKRIPIVATFHSKFHQDFKQALKADVLARMVTKHVASFYNAVDVVWTVNNGAGNTLRSYGYKGEIEIMPNGNDMVDEIDREENCGFFKERYGIAKNDLVFLFVGQLILHKNIPMIIEALHDLQAQGTAFHCFIIGEGPAARELQQMVSVFSLIHRISFTGKITDRNLLARFYARSDLLLFPSLYDNAPLVIREAAAMGTPSVVIEGADAQEGIIDGVNGSTCGHTARSLSEKIRMIVKDKAVIVSLGSRARETIAVSWETIIGRVADRYRKIIEDHRTKR